MGKKLGRPAIDPTARRRSHGVSMHPSTWAALVDHAKVAGDKVSNILERLAVVHLGLAPLVASTDAPAGATVARCGKCGGRGWYRRESGDVYGCLECAV